MALYFPQPSGGSCGPYSLAYYLWETGRSSAINENQFVDGLYQHIQVGKNSLGIPEGYSHPAKMVEELNKDWGVKAAGCMRKGNLLAPDVEEALTNLCDTRDDVFDLLTRNEATHAIIHSRMGKTDPPHHYFMLVKYENQQLKLIDSYQNQGLIDWEVFCLGDDGRLVLTRNSYYYYTGFGILIK